MRTWKTRWNYIPFICSFYVVRSVVQLENADQVSVAMRREHEPAKIDEIPPLIPQQVSEAVHFSVNNTYVTPKYL